MHKVVIHGLVTIQQDLKSFLKQLKTTDLCVLEVTGVYHLLLANFLYSNSIQVSVENPFLDILIVEIL